MGFLDKFKKNEDVDTDFEEEVTEEIEETPVQPATGFPSKDNVLSFTNKTKAGNNLKVMVIEPVSFDDAQQVADFIKNHKPVVVNFENTNSDIAKRIIDFMGGTTYALSGEITKIGKNVFMCAPNNVTVEATEEPRRTTKTPPNPWEE